MMIDFYIESSFFFKHMFDSSSTSFDRASRGKTQDQNSQSHQPGICKIGENCFFLFKYLSRAKKINNQFMLQRAYVEILSTREVWRARKTRKSSSRRSREQLQPFECSPNFPSAQYLVIRTLKHELIVNFFWWVAPPKMFCNWYRISWSQNQLWNCTHFRHPTDEQLRHVDIYFLATKIICSLSTLNKDNDDTIIKLDA